MKQFIVVLVSLIVTTGSLYAADTKKTAVPGTDDLSRYVATKATQGGQSTLRDASGRTLGTASMPRLTVTPPDKPRGSVIVKRK